MSLANEGWPDTGMGENNDNCGEARRNSAQPSPLKDTAAAQKCTHTVRGRNDERYVIDRRDSALVFRGFFTPVPLSRDPRTLMLRRAGGRVRAVCSVVICSGLEVSPKIKRECVGAGKTPSGTD